MSSLEVEGTALFRIHGMAAANGIADPTADLVSAVLILDPAVEHEQFLTAPMFVFRDVGARGETDQTHRLRVTLLPVKGQDRDAGRRARLPLGISCVDDDLLAVAAG